MSRTSLGFCLRLLLISLVSYFNRRNEVHVRRIESSNTTSKKAQKGECPQPVTTNRLSSSHPIFLGSAHNQYLWFMSISPEEYWFTQNEIHIAISLCKIRMETEILRN